MGWDYFIYFALLAGACWLAGAVSALCNKSVLAGGCTFLGLLVMGGFVSGLWYFLQRPPLMTMGETRLWYSLFLPAVGLFTYMRWKYPWVLTFSTVLSSIFMGINLFYPELHSRELMPALQSPWFVPHVIVYMFAYALLGVATWQSVHSLCRRDEAQGSCDMALCCELVRLGWAFLTIGMITGAFWAKEAWGHYWTWDPKETWAAVTWFSYLVFVHLHAGYPHRRQWAWSVLILSFLFLQLCWWGLNYLPAIQGQSAHLYGAALAWGFV